MSELAQVLRHVLPVEDPNALVGHETGDDAAVYRLADDRALVVTADFFTPMVDDPYDFGRIAAANALSDVWAMGGHPLWGLNLMFFPNDKLPLSVMRRMMDGARDKCAEAKVSIVGGHTVRNGDLKYGLAVTGMLDTGRRRAAPCRGRSLCDRA